MSGKLPHPAHVKSGQPQSSSEQSHCLAVTILSCSWHRPCDYGFSSHSLPRRQMTLGRVAAAIWISSTIPELTVGSEKEGTRGTRGEAGALRSGHQASRNFYRKASKVLPSPSLSVSRARSGTDSSHRSSFGLMWPMPPRQALYRTECLGLCPCLSLRLFI